VRKGCRALLRGSGVDCVGRTERHQLVVSTTVQQKQSGAPPVRRPHTVRTPSAGSQYAVSRQSACRQQAVSMPSVGSQYAVSRQSVCHQQAVSMPSAGSQYTLSTHRSEAPLVPSERGGAPPSTRFLHHDEARDVRAFGCGVSASPHRPWGIHALLQTAASVHLYGVVGVAQRLRDQRARRWGVCSGAPLAGRRHESRQST
jgi:hypothetical protein